MLLVAGELEVALAEVFGVPEGQRLRDTPPWRPYREVLRDSLEFDMHTTGLTVKAADFDGLITRISSLLPTPTFPPLWPSCGTTDTDWQRSSIPTTN